MDSAQSYFYDLDRLLTLNSEFADKDNFQPSEDV